MQSPGQPLDARDRVEITFYLSLRFALRLKVDIKRLSAPRSGSQPYQQTIDSC